MEDLKNLASGRSRPWSRKRRKRKPRAKTATPSRAPGEGGSGGKLVVIRPSIEVHVSGCNFYLYVWSVDINIVWSFFLLEYNTFLNKQNIDAFPFRNTVYLPKYSKIIIIKIMIK